MSTQQFASAEDINTHYEQQLTAAGDDATAIANIRAERGERLAEFHANVAQQAQSSQRKAWVDAALLKHGIPSDLRDMVERFESEEDINKAAERLGVAVKAPAAANLYGGGTGGGGTPPRQSKDPDGEWLSDFERRYNAREPMTIQEHQRYISTRLGRHTYRAMKENGKQHLWGPQAEPDFERY